MHDVCLLWLVADVSPAGVWGVRTRAITANKDGTLEWVERLILELHGPIGETILLQLKQYCTQF